MVTEYGRQRPQHATKQYWSKYQPQAAQHPVTYRTIQTGRRNLEFHGVGTNVRVLGLQCGTYVNFEGPARVAIQGLTWVNFRFLTYPVNSGRPAWLTVQRRGTLPVAPAQATRVSAGEL